MPIPKKPIRIVVILLVLGALGFFLYSYLLANPENGGGIHIYGNVEIREVRLAFESPGRIAQIHVNEGDRVAAGQLLAEIETDRYQAAVEQARSEVAAQEEVLRKLRAGSRPEEIAAARARVNVAEALLVEAQRTHRRTKSLIHSNSVSRQELDDSQARLDSAKAELELRKQLLQLEINGPREEDVAAARATLEARRAALSLAETNLGDARLLAPSEGVIRDRILEPGDMAFTEKPVLTLALTSPLWVRAYIPEPDLGKIAPGMRAEITTDSFPDKRYPGWVGYISDTAEFTPKQVQTTELRSKLVYQVRVFVCNPRNELRMGMPVTVTIDPGAAATRTPAAGDPCGEG